MTHVLVAFLVVISIFVYLYIYLYLVLTKESFNGFPFFENTVVRANKDEVLLNAYNSYYPIDNSTKLYSAVPTDQNTIVDSNGFFKIKNKYGLLYPFYTDTENII